MKKQESLDSYIWFNGKIDRLDAEKLLKNGNCLTPVQMTSYLRHSDVILLFQMAITWFVHHQVRRILP